MIYENAYLIPKEKKHEISKLDKYLIIAKEVTEEEIKEKKEKFGDNLTKSMNKFEAEVKAMFDTSFD